MKPGKKKCDLRSCVMCRTCIREWLPAIDANRQTFTLKKGELLFTEGHEVKGMFFITRGLVKVHKHWDDDKELILRIAGSGEIAGHRGLGGDPFYPASATTLGETEACYVNMDFFNSTLRVNADFLHWLMMFFATELKESERRMRNLAHMPAKGRIANMILALTEKFGTTDDGAMAIQLSRQDLASYTGTAYETFFRLLNELVEEGLLGTDGKRISILDAEKLKGYAKNP